MELVTKVIKSSEAAEPRNICSINSGKTITGAAHRNIKTYLQLIWRCAAPSLTGHLFIYKDFAALPLPYYERILKDSLRIISREVIKSSEAAEPRNICSINAGKMGGGAAHRNIKTYLQLILRCAAPTLTAHLFIYKDFAALRLPCYEIILKDSLRIIHHFENKRNLITLVTYDTRIRTNLISLFLH